MKTTLFFLAFLLSFSAQGNNHSYDDIAKRNPASSLTEEQVIAAKMQGECLVGLKKLNFKKLKEFDPVSEWTSYRSISLLQHYSPCEVLIIMEVAQKSLRE